ncbi:OsmC family protein [Nocardia neocaledoniensis]|uniref:OsmC family protein n=1 Tax=Nocardia neocaledoniensis TaxID=236511 RepID=UPI002458DACA|nr:OsmC family protein [Nocardia neocaledoniensis]
MTTAAELKAKQASVKQRYRDDPAAAITALRAVGSFADPGITCTVRTFAGPVRAGLHPATGGDGSDACSGDMLLEALAACAGVTCRSVATAMALPITGAEIETTGSFDATGTLGINRNTEIGVSPITVTITVTTSSEVDPAALTTLAELTERYCVVGRSLRHPPVVRVVRAERLSPRESE